jgi:hypothetical protein
MLSSNTSPGHSLAKPWIPGADQNPIFESEINSIILIKKQYVLIESRQPTVQKNRI